MSVSRFTTALCALALTLSWVSSAKADQWKKNRGNCDDTAFSRPVETDIKKIASCVRLLEAYRNGKFEEQRYKDKVIAAMRRLYQNGTPMDANIARIGLSRMGIGVPPKAGDKPKAVVNAAVNKRNTRTKFRGCPGGTQPTPTTDKKPRKKAKKAFKAGMKAYKKDDFAGALSRFEEMLGHNPNYKAIYNVATMSAKTGNKKRALGLLWCLRDIGSENALRKVKDARKDDDFEGMRGEDEFKVVTGYARILIFDSLPEGRGDDNVSNLKDRIEKLKYVVLAVKPDANEKTEPLILYRSTNRAQAYVFKRILSHPHTKLLAMTAKQEKRGYDIVIIWGDRYKKDEDPPLRINEVGEDMDQELKDIEKTEDAILGKPGEYEKKLDDALGDGEKAVDRAGDQVDKVEDLTKKPGETVDKINSTIDKVKKPF